MKLYAQGLARVLHEQRVQNSALPRGQEPPEAPEPPGTPDGLQKVSNDCSRPSHARENGPISGGEYERGRALALKPRVANRVKPLNQSQQAAVELLVLGHSDDSTANHLGLHRMTICKWRLHHPAFRAELNRRRQEVWTMAAEKFRNRLDKAIDVLEKQMDDVEVTTRFRAARTMLALARHFRPPDEPIDVEGILTLEARRINVQMYEVHPSQSLVYEDDRAEALRHLSEKAGEDFALPDDAKTDEPDSSVS